MFITAASCHSETNDESPGAGIDPFGDARRACIFPHQPILAPLEHPSRRYAPHGQHQPPPARPPLCGRQSTIAPRHACQLPLAMLLLFTQTRCERAGGQCVEATRPGDLAENQPWRSSIRIMGRAVTWRGAPTAWLQRRPPKGSVGAGKKKLKPGGEFDSRDIGAGLVRSARKVERFAVDA